MTNNPQEPKYLPADTDGQPISDPMTYSVMPSEYASVVFTQLYGKIDGQVVQFNLTIRANNGREAIDQLIDASKYAKERYHLSLARPDISQPVPAQQAPSLQKPPALSAPALSAPQSPASAVPGAASGPALPARPAPGATNVKPGTPNVVTAVKLKVTPQAGEKAKLEWFAASHNFADIYAVKTVEQWLNILPAEEGWDAEYLAKVGEYTVAHNVAWVESEKLNSANRPYKNITSITPR